MNSDCYGLPDLRANSLSRPSRAIFSARITVPEIARRLGIGRLAVYEMLERQIIPAVRVGRRWIVTRYAYNQWERTCGTRASTGLVTQKEVTVLN